MIIGTSAYTLSAASARQVEQTHSERLRMWDDRGERGNGGGPQGPAGRPTALVDEVNLSASQLSAARAMVYQARSGRPGNPPGAERPPAAQGPPPVAPGGPEGADPTGSDDASMVAQGRFQVLIALVENLTGRRVHVIDPSRMSDQGGAGVSPATQPPASGGGGEVQARQGWGIDYERVDTRVESEQMSFSAAGRVTTADGRSIEFAVDMSMSRQSVEVSSLRFRAGDATLTDPLVLNFGGSPVGLSPSSIDFDLNADGQSEKISFVADGNGFLVLDNNGNGAVDDGSELFGPTTGSGFGELAAYDDDGNGWIDEADAVFSRLRVWDQADGELKTLAERGVGAIALGNVDTGFDLEAGGRTAGVLRSTGVWLGEDGSVGTVHHVDLAM